MTEKIQEIKIIVSEIDPEWHAGKVNTAIREGWKLLAPMTVVVQGYALVFIQTLTRNSTYGQ